MKLIKVMRRSLLYNIVIIAVLGLAACNNTTEETPPVVEDQYTAGQLNVVTNAMDFQSRDTLAAGWNTITYENKSTDVHFLVLEKYPEGKGINDAKAEVVPIFQQAMNLIMEGKQDDGFAEFAKLPKWFSAVEFRGGTGLIAPGKTATTTLQVSAGTYVMECYVKMSDGHFHSAMGMIKQIVFVEAANDNVPPKADVKLEISAAGGIVTSDSIAAGEQWFAVNFIDQKQYDNFVGHDVNLVRLRDGVEITELEDWMNWVNPKGFMSPAPAQFDFMGGTQEMPAGNTAYFKADLTPGNYAFIAEVPEPDKNKLLYRFTVK